MAHASIDYHMDFISLLSLANIGMVEPEVLMIKNLRKKPQETTVEHIPQADSGRNGVTYLSQDKKGVSVHLTNGFSLERGLKRGRENGGELEALEQDLLYEGLSKVKF